MLYDGHENAFTKWMRDRDVDIIFAETYLKNDLQAERVNDSRPPHIAAWCIPPHGIAIPWVAVENGR